MGSGLLSYEYALKLGAKKTDIKDYDGTAVFKNKYDAFDIANKLLKDLEKDGKNEFANTTVIPHCGPGHVIAFFK